MIEFWAVVSRPVLLGCIKETYLHCDGVSCIKNYIIVSLHLDSFFFFLFLFFFSFFFNCQYLGLSCVLQIV